MRESYLASLLLYGCGIAAFALVSFIIFRGCQAAIEAAQNRQEMRHRRERQARMRRMKLWAMPRLMPIGLKRIDLSTGEAPHIEHRYIHIHHSNTSTDG